MAHYVLSTVMEDTEKNRKLIEAAMKHDWILYQNNGMSALTLSAWIRFIINKRLSEIAAGQL